MVKNMVKDFGQIIILQLDNVTIKTPKYFVKKIWDTECSFTGTFKNNEFDKGILVSSKGSFKGTFKNNKFKISNG